MKNRLLKTLTPLVLVVLLVATLMSVFVLTAGAEEQTYEKVTTAPDDWSGTYLIVYEDGNVAFNGSLTTLDAVSNTTSVTITDGKITGDFSACTFVIENPEITILFKANPNTTSVRHQMQTVLSRVQAPLIQTPFL